MGGANCSQCCRCPGCAAPHSCAQGGRRSNIVRHASKGNALFWIFRKRRPPRRAAEEWSSAGVVKSCPALTTPRLTALCTTHLVAKILTVWDQAEPMAVWTSTFGVPTLSSGTLGIFRTTPTNCSILDMSVLLFDQEPFRSEAGATSHAGILPQSGRTRPKLPNFGPMFFSTWAGHGRSWSTPGQF